MYIVSVPTPYDKFSKKVDACYVVAAVKEVMKVCRKGAIVVIESTVSPGTIDRFVRPAIEEVGFVIGEDINLVHAPERIIPGNMVYELIHNNRTIGADDRVIGERVKEYYTSSRCPCPVGGRCRGRWKYGRPTWQHRFVS